MYVYRECLKHNYRVSIMKRAQYWQCWGSMHSTQMWGAHISVFFISNVVSRNSMVFLRSLLKTRKESYVKGSILNFIWEILTLILFLVKFKKCWFILFGNRGCIEILNAKNPNWADVQINTICSFFFVFSELISKTIEEIINKDNLTLNKKLRV